MKVIFVLLYSKHNNPPPPKKKEEKTSYHFGIVIHVPGITLVVV